MSKFLYKEIKEIISRTPKELDNKSTTDIHNIEWIGGYSAPSWNWGYKVGAFVYKNKVCVAVFQFGHIVAR